MKRRRWYLQREQITSLHTHSFIYIYIFVYMCIHRTNNITHTLVYIYIFMYIYIHRTNNMYTNMYMYMKVWVWSDVICWRCYLQRATQFEYICYVLQRVAVCCSVLQCAAVGLACVCYLRTIFLVNTWWIHVCLLYTLLLTDLFAMHRWVERLVNSEQMNQLTNNLFPLVYSICICWLIYSLYTDDWID